MNKKAYILEWDNGESYEDSFSYPLAVFIDKIIAEKQRELIGKLVKEVYDNEPEIPSPEDVSEREKYYREVKVPYNIELNCYTRGFPKIIETILID